MDREERIYSVTMTEDELRMFSEFLEQKNFDNLTGNDHRTKIISGYDQYITNYDDWQEDDPMDIALTHARGSYLAGETVKAGLDNVSKGVKTAGIALGSGIALAGAAGAYSRVKAAKLAAKRNKEEAESKYKTSKEDKKNKKEDKEKK